MSTWGSSGSLSTAGDFGGPIEGAFAGSGPTSEKRWSLSSPVVSEPTRLTVLAGPTAVGKGTVTSWIRLHHPEVWVSVSVTTRAQRPGEVDGVHYHFISEAAFDQMIAEDQLLEWAVVHKAARYGTPRAPVEAALAAGKPALLEIDLQGARQVRERMPQARFVFLAPPSWEELVNRLVGRGTEGPQERERRLETARQELAAESEFDHIIVNTEIQAAAEELVSLLNS